MTLPSSLYVSGDSWLHRLDARLKLGFAVLSTLVLLSLNSLALSLFFLALCHAVLLSARVPLSRLGQAWRLLLPMTLLIPVLWPLFSNVDGPLLFQLGPVTVTWTDVWLGLAMAMRVDAMAFVFLVWLFTTHEMDMVLGFVSLGMPYEWGLTFAITLRYVPILFAAFEQVMDAQRARGLVISRTNPLQASRAYVPALVPMLILALRTAENLSRALEARAFGAPGIQHTIRRRLHFSSTDSLVLVAVVVLLGAVILAHFLWGVAAGPIL